MATPDLPERLRAHIAKLEGRPPLETVEEFMFGHVADADSLDEIRTRLEQIARRSTSMHRRTLRALEAVITTELPPNTLARLVVWDGNWSLDDPSDAGAADFLRGLAQMLREVIEQAD
ncbi:hypothetical protein AB0M20_11780 [Actinoplanes sp. NPDC051633]|uniref:hypothetical protein n=1 Tax=Actinoplanes sp. NPDC051633 TaxID=3155670 RepID=UPI003435C2EB